MDWGRASWSYSNHQVSSTMASDGHRVRAGDILLLLLRVPLHAASIHQVVARTGLSGKIWEYLCWMPYRRSTLLCTGRHRLGNYACLAWCFTQPIAVINRAYIVKGLTKSQQAESELLPVRNVDLFVTWDAALIHVQWPHCSSRTKNKAAH